MNPSTRVPKRFVIYLLGFVLPLLFAGFVYMNISAVEPPRVSVGASVPGAVDEESIIRFVSEYMQSSGVPGASIVITKGQDVAFSAGFGSDSRGAPITTRTPMPIASLAKSFTSLAVLQLVEDGMLEIDAPVVAYLPEFTMGDERHKEITVRQLLDQTSGMADAVFAEKSLPQPNNLREAVARLSEAPLLSDPGTAWYYHNPNYQVAARLVEVVSGEPFASYLETHVFDPLGMSSTFAVDNLSSAGLPQGTIHAYGGVMALPEPLWYVGGAGGVVTTADDLAKWLILHATATSSSDILTTRGIEHMHTGASDVHPYALGWIPGEMNGVATAAHNGWMFTYTADQIIIPEGEWGVGVMTNGGLSLAGTDSDMLYRGILAILMTGQAPVVSPTGLILDFVFGLLTILAVVLGVRGILNVGCWTNRWSTREGWQKVLSILLVLLPLAVLSMYPIIMGAAFGGRDATWEQILYVAPAPTIFLGVAALFGLIVAILRTWRLVRRPASAAPQI